MSDRSERTDGEVALGWVTIVFSPFIVGGLTVIWVANRLLREWVLRWKVARCPRGHEVHLRGGWLCHCKCTYAGHAFAACPHCGEHAHGIQCACGVTVISPLSPMRGWR